MQLKSPASLAAAALLALVPSVSSAQIAQSEYASRRDALATLVGDGVLVAFGSPEPEEDYISFNQNSQFKYLTGFNEPAAALIVDIKGGKIVGAPELFVQPNDPSREVWTGKRLGIAGARSVGFDAHSSDSLITILDQLLLRPGTTGLSVVGDYSEGSLIQTPVDQRIGAVASRHSNVKVRSANDAVLKLRGVKSAAELDLIMKAVAITVDAQHEAMRYIEPGQNEFETQALIEYTFRRDGADRPSFSTIVGSGPNSTTLHYNEDDRFFGRNEVVVMDIGASYHGYSADVTRTVPISGKFSADQRAIYQAVRGVQATAERQAKLNALGHIMADSATAAMNQALAKLGLIEAPGATYDCDSTSSKQCPQSSLYYMHGLGHGIGLDVHDPGTAGSRGGTARLVPGSAFTIEPGIYVRENLLDIIPRTLKNLATIQHIRPAVERYRNIGVRIEDDYIMTDRGVEWISHAPREIEEIEAAMREPWTGPSPRDAAKVEWYRSTTPRAP
jgi:Xaa-Pro aminopeptidase